MPKGSLKERQKEKKSWRVRLGDCIEVLKSYPDNYFDCCPTDPPYALSFGNHAWDTFANPRKFQKWVTEWAKEVYRVLKPGAYLLAFGGTRTYHRLACGIEDAGFESRDTIYWIYGSGFPKSSNISKLLDKRAGAQREVVGVDESRLRPNRKYKSGALGNVLSKKSRKISDRTDNGATITAPSTDLAKKWSGWGTALRPSVEPIVCFRKPLEGTIMDNVTTYGVGGLNIEATRIPRDEPIPVNVLEEWSGFGNKINPKYQTVWSNQGGWPANILYSHSPECTDDLCSDDCVSKLLELQQPGCKDYFFSFKYCIKPTKTERDLGMDDFADKDTFETVGRAPDSAGALNPRAGAARTGKSVKNSHPTLKPISLMRYLIRMICPEGGHVLDPFSGSGTCGMGAVLEGREYTGIEKKKKYRTWGKARIQWAYDNRKVLRKHDRLDKVSKQVDKVNKTFTRTLFG